MSVRKATQDDVLDIVLLARQFLKEAKTPIKLDKALFTKNLEATLDNANYFFYVSEQEGEVIGCLAGQISNTIFSSVPIAVEIGWFIDPAYRKARDGLKLFSTFEQWAKSKGCEAISMGDLAEVQDLAPLYKRRGYELFERTYIKELK